MSCEILLCHYGMINLNVETRVLSGKGLFFFFPPLAFFLFLSLKIGMSSQKVNEPQLSEQLPFIPI